MTAKNLAVCAILLLSLVTGGRMAYASNPKGSNLKLAGTIVAVENLFGHIYSSDKINTSYLIVRVDRMINGQERSHYIHVSYKWRLKDKLDPLSQRATQWEFELTKAPGCAKTLKELQYVEFGTEEEYAGTGNSKAGSWYASLLIGAASHNAFNRSAKSVAFMRAILLVIMARRARLIRA